MIIQSATIEKQAAACQQPVATKILFRIKHNLNTNYYIKVLSHFYFFYIHLIKSILFNAEANLEGARGARATHVFFCNNLFFCNHFKELQAVLIEVKLIINNATLTYVYPNTIKTCLTLNHFFFGRQLSYYSNTTSTVVRNLTVLSSTTDKINLISNHFSHRCRHEYVVNLRETQRTSKLNINSKKSMFCQFVMKRCPDTFGKFPQ